MNELPSHEYISSLAEKASTVLENENTTYRPSDMNGKPGSLLELEVLPAIIVPDLHARPYFLEDILKYMLSYDFCGTDNYVFKKITVEQALEEKLVNAHINFEVCRDRATMMTMGLDFLPALDIDGTILNFKESIDWVRKQG